MTLSARARRIVTQAVAKVPPRFRDASRQVFDANGSLERVVPWGAAQALGTTRAFWGLREDDLAGIRKRLRKVGARGSIAELDGAIYEAMYDAAMPAQHPADNDASAAFVPAKTTEDPMTDATRRARITERKRLLGLCTHCPIGLRRPPAPGATVCAQCSAKAYERVKARRARISATASEPAAVDGDSVPDYMLRIPGDA